jgi:hypothetical protein
MTRLFEAGFFVFGARPAGAGKDEIKFAQTIAFVRRLLLSIRFFGPSSH